MRPKGLLAVIICIIILTGCNNSKFGNKDKTVDSHSPSVSGDFKNHQKEDKAISPIKLDDEESIKEYLIGEWIYDYYYRGDVICKMNIDKDLNIHLSFENSYSDQPKGDYLGKITLDRLYADTDQAPDLISIELIDTEEPGGDFLFQHRTIYDQKRVMAWFFAGNGNSVFDILDFTGDFTSTPEEIIFEKTTGEKSKEKSRENDEFYAVYWGMGSDKKSIWLDDVWWTPSEYDDSDPTYMSNMTRYQTDIAESVLYNIDPKEISEILGDDLTEGQVYYVQTDAKGNINYFMSADRKKWIEENDANYEMDSFVVQIIENLEEVEEYMSLGMTIEFDGSTFMIEGEEYYEVALGTQHEEYFVREIHYAVNTLTHEVYRYDVLNDIWEPVRMD